MYIGKRIQELRKQNNITQEELAAQLGVTAAAVSKWENSYTLPDVLMLCALADYFGVTTDDLLGRSTTLKEAVVVAETDGLGKKIGLLAEKYDLTIVDHFTTYREALSYALSHESCKYILTGGSRDLISAADISDTPSEINSMHVIGDNDENVLQGFEQICSHLHLFEVQ